MGITFNTLMNNQRKVLLEIQKRRYKCTSSKNNYALVQDKELRPIKIPVVRGGHRVDVGLSEQPVFVYFMGEKWLMIVG